MQRVKVELGNWLKNLCTVRMCKVPGFRLGAAGIKLQDARHAGKIGPTEEPLWERCG